jgi:CheY-like chemotaxis protein
VRSPIQHIFLIDDEDDSHFVTKLVLRKAGYEGRLSLFASAAEAIAALRIAAAPPDLILVDIHMPGTGGFEFVERCESAGLLPNDRSSVVMFSGSNRPQDRENARRFASVAGYVEKALTVERFEQIVALHNRRA